MPDPHARVAIDGIEVDAVTEAVAVSLVADALGRGRGGLMLTANADILRQLRQPDLRPLADHADLVVADGMPLVWASQLQGRPVPERVAGSDLLWSLSAVADAVGYPVYLFGAGPGVAEEAAAQLTARYPGLDVCGWSSPPLGFEDDAVLWDRAVQDLVSAAPRLVFVALGFPKQERVSLRLAQQLPTTWFLGCGGSLDMAAGRTTRAPEWARKAGVEWVYRLLQEPRRLAGRYLVHDAPYVLAMLARATLRGLRSRFRPATDGGPGR